jgi:hypothetical protein
MLVKIVGDCIHYTVDGVPRIFKLGDVYKIVDRPTHINTTPLIWPVGTLVKIYSLRLFLDGLSTSWYTDANYSPVVDCTSVGEAKTSLRWWVSLHCLQKTKTPKGNKIV